jgi:cytoskeletal protein CcmA (bactofilin family)
MWKKEDGPSVPDTNDNSPRTAGPRTANATGRAVIGPSISIKGDVTGSEDLLIQGKVDGSVTLDHHAVGVGSEGRVNANIIGRIITIEGRVEGDLTAEEQIILRGSAQVHGDIKAPRVVLEDGATFRGLVDMGASSKKSGAPETVSVSKPSGTDARAGTPSKDAQSGSSDAGKSAAKAGQANS